MYTGAKWMELAAYKSSTMCDCIRRSRTCIRHATFLGNSVVSPRLQTHTHTLYTLAPDHHSTRSSGSSYISSRDTRALAIDSVRSIGDKWYHQSHWSTARSLLHRLSLSSESFWHSLPAVSNTVPFFSVPVFALDASPIYQKNGTTIRSSVI